jgi:hypothetical protein
MRRQAAENGEPHVGVLTTTLRSADRSSENITSASRRPQFLSSFLKPLAGYRYTILDIPVHRRTGNVGRSKNTPSASSLGDLFKPSYGRGDFNDDSWAIPTSRGWGVLHANNEKLYGFSVRKLTYDSDLPNLDSVFVQDQDATQGDCKEEHENDNLHREDTEMLSKKVIQRVWEEKENIESEEDEIAHGLSLSQFDDPWAILLMHRTVDKVNE